MNIKRRVETSERFSARFRCPESSVHVSPKLGSDAGSPDTTRTKNTTHCMRVTTPGPRPTCVVGVVRMHLRRNTTPLALGQPLNHNMPTNVNSSSALHIGCDPPLSSKLPAWEASASMSDSHRSSLRPTIRPRCCLLIHAGEQCAAPMLARASPLSCKSVPPGTRQEVSRGVLLHRHIHGPLGAPRSLTHPTLAQPPSAVVPRGAACHLRGVPLALPRPPRGRPPLPPRPPLLRPSACRRLRCRGLRWPPRARGTCARGTCAPPRTASTPPPSTAAT